MAKVVEKVEVVTESYVVEFTAAELSTVVETLNNSDMYCETDQPYYIANDLERTRNCVDNPPKRRSK